MGFLISPKWEQSCFERGACSVGVDEVGRGCLAGPVVAAAVSIPQKVFMASENEWWHGLYDSKLLTMKERRRLSLLIWQECLVQVAWCEPQEIDEINILQASFKAMRTALKCFRGAANVVYVDGHLSPYSEKNPALMSEQRDLGFHEVVTVVKGDSKVLSIAAASIVAKVFRDQWMDELEEIFPVYGFSKHKGYPTAFHKEALRQHGPSLVHRRSFAGVVADLE